VLSKREIGTELFSGIVKAKGVVLSCQSGELKIESSLFLSTDFEEGASIAISGVCLTVVSQNDGVIHFQLASETQQKTTLGQLEAGSTVNLEPALCLGDPLDGHLMLGHVDTTCELLEVTAPDSNTHRMLFSLPAGLESFVAPKGSVAISGVSLTVGEVTDKDFSVYIIPLTWSETILGNLKTGDYVNFEADCLARYVQRAMEVNSKVTIKGRS